MSAAVRTAVETPTPTARRRRSWTAVAATLFMVAWGGNEFTPLLVMYREVDGLSALHVNLLLAIYVLGIVPAMLIGGPLSDRLGRKPVLLPAPILSIVGSTLLALGGLHPGLLAVGRLFSGLALGLVMAVGTSWIKELSEPPHDDADPGTKARRASLWQTAGFGLGAAVAALLAQFGPWQTVLPYLVNIALTVPVVVLLARTPETRPAVPRAQRRPLRYDLAIPAAAHRRFLLVVAPMAPWVFGAGATAYAILPNLSMARAGDFSIAYSGLLCAVGLGCGFAIQPLTRRLADGDSVRPVVVGLAAVAAGLGVSAAAVATGMPIWLTILAAAVLGCGYGLALVAGLLEIQRLAGPDDLAGLTAVFYALTYVGFFVPALLAALAPWLTYTQMFLGGGLLCLACLGLVLAGRNVPATPR